MDDQQITDALTHHAAHAPSDHTLLSTVHTRLRRRRTGRAIGAAVLVTAMIASAFTTTHLLRAEPEVAENPQSWRWESYKTAEVQVPDSWNHYVDGPAPCGMSASGVGRLSVLTPYYTCSYAVAPLKSRVPYVWFDDVQSPGIVQYDGGWSEETRLVGSTKVTVLASSEKLRRQILDTARPIATQDQYGCPRELDPSDNGILNPNGDGVQICAYAGSSLVGSTHLPTSEAALLEAKLNTSGGNKLRQCPDGEERDYRITLFLGAEIRRMWRTDRRCPPAPPFGLDSLRDGPLNPYDPSTSYDPAKPITPPTR